MDTEDILKIVVALEDLVHSVPQQLREDDTLRRRLLVATRKLIPEIESPIESAQRLLYTPIELMAAKVGVDLEIFTTLAESDHSLRTEELGKRSGADNAMLSRLLKYQNSIGLIKEQGADLWGPSNTSKNLSLRSNAAGINFMFECGVPAYWAVPSWLKRKNYQTPTEMTDGAFAQGHREPAEQTFYSWISTRPEMAKEFSIFAAGHRIGTKTWLDGVDFESMVYKSRALSIGSDENGPMFVDVGGGLGQQCEALRSRYPKMKGQIILQDLPGVIAKASLSSGIEKMAVDMFNPQPIRGAAIYYLRNVLRNWSDDRCQTILGQLRDAMGYQSVVVIDDIVVPDQAASKESTQLDMGMLALLSTEARTERQWKKLLRESSLQLLHIKCFEEIGRESVIIAQRIPTMA